VLQDRCNPDFFNTIDPNATFRNRFSFPKPDIERNQRSGGAEADVPLNQLF
jgi:hypothetical protein